MGQRSSAGIDKQTVKLCISFPSKTFLIGEYAVMAGAPALLVNTRPRFQFHIQQTAKSVHPFHKDSPSGRFMEENKEVFSSVAIQYLKNYESGFGLSGAEFNCVYLLKILLKGGFVEDISCFDILEKYLSYFPHPREERHPRESGDPYTPSGADLISQWLGKVCIFSSPSLAESIDWPFKNLSFALIQTGESFKTWEHLENLKQKNFSQLNEISLTALEAVRSSSESLFLQSIQDYRNVLEKEGLTHPSTKKILQELSSHSEVLAVKGCGAMGAEVIAVFFKKEMPLDFLNAYKVIAGLRDLDQGVRVDEL